MIPRSDEGDMIKTSSSALNLDLLQWIPPKLKLWESVELVEKKFEILTECSLKNKESIKKMVHDSEFEWERYVQNKCKCSKFEPAPMNSNWTEIFGGLTSFPIAWCEQLGKFSMMELQNELHTRTTLDHKWTYTRLRNRSRPKGGHGGVIWKHGCMWHP